MFNSIRSLLIYFLRSIVNISEGEATLKVDAFLKTTTSESLLKFISEFEKSKLDLENAQTKFLENVDLLDFVNLIKENTTEIPK